MADLLYWVWLADTLTPGSDAFAKLRTSFSSPKAIFRADEAALKEALGSRYYKTIQKLLNKDLTRARNIMDFITMQRVGVLTYDDRAFPPMLREIKNPPVLLYYVGELPDFSHYFGVSIVGSREHNEYAMRQTFEISRDLARGGATVINGMAKGIDGIALAGAIDGGGRVVAFLGSGIDLVYPPDHALLCRRVTVKGVVMTEYSPGTPPYARNFPVRNRLISAMGHVTLVTAGTLKSGALITAHYAKEQGKALYALPGNVDEPYMEATALLLREGNKAAVCAEDILYAYEKEFPDIINIFRLLEQDITHMGKVLKSMLVAVQSVEGKHKNVSKPNHPAPILGKGDTYFDHMYGQKVATIEDFEIPETRPTENELLSGLPEGVRMVYDKIPRGEICRIDTLVDESLPPSKVMVAITLLEMKGLVEQRPGSRVVRKY